MIVLNNTTKYFVQFVVMKGEQVVAHLPGIEPGGTVSVPIANTYTVIATTQLEGNTYTSAPLTTTGGQGFRAQVLQTQQEGTYAFDVAVFASPDPNQLIFEKTTLNPVTFSILEDGKPLQSIVVDDDFKSRTVNIGGSYSVQAVINGVSTAAIQTNDPNAVINAVDNSTNVQAGEFTLVLGVARDGKQMTDGIVDESRKGCIGVLWRRILN